MEYLYYFCFKYINKHCNVKMCIILNLFVVCCLFQFLTSTFNLSCFPQFLRQSSPSCIIDLNFSLFRVRFGTIPSVATSTTILCPLSCIALPITVPSTTVVMI